MRKIALFSIAVLVAFTALAALPKASAQVGEAWHGYVLMQLAGGLTNGLTDDQMLRVRQAWEVFAPRSGDWPPYLLQYRFNLAKTAAIVEARFYALPSKAQVVAEIAARLGVTTTVVSNNLTITVFGGVGSTWEQSRTAAAAYLLANRAAWEVE